MNKICTTVEQSKKLIELGIDVNTADMSYCPVMDIDSRKNNSYLEVPECYSFSKVKDFLVPYLPAWSLTALLGLMPTFTLNGFGNGQFNCRDERANSYALVDTCPLDAAFEMVCWLLENKKL